MSQKKSPGAKGSPWPGHPYHRDNNINGIDGDPDNDGNGYEVHTLTIPAITALQEAYIRKVIETVGDFDNIIYEISNESHGNSTDWQFHMINFIKKCEHSRPMRHPVWMTFQYDKTFGPGTNQTLFDSPAEAISPNSIIGRKEVYRSNPPAADGSKVILLDTDHLWGIGGDAVWVWKAFTRGMNPLFMDPSKREAPLDQFGLSSKWDGIRAAMGITLKLAERIDLATLTPQPGLADTGYCLASPGRKYLVYLPDGGEATLNLTGINGEFNVQWVHPTQGTLSSITTIPGDARQTLKAPYPGHAAVYVWTSSPND